jgi:hypothetical protein
MRSLFIAKSTAVGVALLPVTLVFCPTAASPQPGVGDMSCDVVLDYVATSPPYTTLFMAFLEGYVAGEKKSSALGGDDRADAALMSKAVDYCKKQPNEDFKSAIAAVANK